MANKRIRVYELARELGLSNKEALDLCERLRIGVKSHSSSIEDPQADRVRRLADAEGLRRHTQPEEPEPAAAAPAAAGAAGAVPAPVGPAVEVRVPGVPVLPVPEATVPAVRTTSASLRPRRGACPASRSRPRPVRRAPRARVAEGPAGPVGRGLEGS